ncbi:phospholipid-transporting ATPase-like protein [Novymonas esmeraldas]|uniref:Phospholipid-transporting ATPase-like protein n=1 Tax=Novymonas esmeraldas TaxID=1808958 RepID=A0AAW0ETF9_9TRYP
MVRVAGVRQWVRRLFAKPAKDRSSEQRVVRPHDPRGPVDFCDNRVCSSKYNVFTFLPLNVWEQFHRPINVYFLLVAALQFIPSVAPVSPFTTIFPISVAFLINAVKEGIDDLRRHRQDVEVNERVHQRVRPGTLETEEVRSADIHVGDVLILHPFEVVPSDVVILLTSHDSGAAYITTESLDGETGSKQRFALLHRLFKYSCTNTTAAASAPPAPQSPEVVPDTADAYRSASQEPGAVALVPMTDLQHGDSTPEELQLQCLRYVFGAQIALSSEGPNAQLHSYHGVAAVRVPRGASPTRGRDGPPSGIASGGTTTPAAAAAAVAAAAVAGAGARLHSGGVSPAQASPPPAADLPRAVTTVMSDYFPRPLPMPEMKSLSLHRSLPRTVDASVDAAFPHPFGDERTGLLASEGGPGPHTAVSAATDGDHVDGHEQTLPVNIDNVVYSSSSIGNTQFIIALVIFTGRETKMGMTRNVPPTKWATIDQRFNYLTIFLFVVQFILVSACAVISAARLRAHASLWYLGAATKPVEVSEYFPILPLRYLMMLSPMVPLSFKVMVEISKAYVSCVIRWDEDMCTEDVPASVNNSALAEELGQVEYVLSDKTGTLTANTMTFRALATVTDVIFSADADDATTGAEPEQHRPLSEVGQTVKAGLALGAREDYYLLLNMTLCNTIERTLPPRISSSSTSAHGSRSTRSSAVGTNPSAFVPSRWMSSSPDEVALVDGAEQCGFSLRQRTRNGAVVGLWGEAGASLEVEVVHTLPFNSDRGMMSVLLRCPAARTDAPAALHADGKVPPPPPPPAMNYVLLIKGADEKVLPRCTDAYSSSHLESITGRLARFSREGLRTLVYGYRVLTEEEAREALRRFAAVEASFASTANREAELQRVYALLEHNFTYCGITAVKDELQAGVSQTLAQLRHANIRVWMLTGDKTETAKQTAVACGLLTSADRVFTLTPPGEDMLTPAEHLEYVARKLADIMELVAQDSTVAGSAATMWRVSRWQKVCGWCRRYFWELSGLEDFVHEFTRPAACERIRPVDHPLVTQSPSAFRALHGPVSQAVLDMVPTVCGAVRRRPGLYFGSTFTASPAFHTSGLKRGYCVALSGKTLRLLEKEDVASHGHSAVVLLFQHCLLQARSVVCSRTAPSLKSYVVEMVRRAGHITLAIGDGGNDVPMLQAAHVGVGLKGREGSQAKLAADFAISEFRFLSKLILVHGHTAYQRTAMIVQQSFWKTVLIAWVQVLFNASTDFSGVSYWDSLSLTLYNAIPTVPVTFLCVMDMPLSHRLLRATPQLYSMSQRGRYLNATTFYGYVARAFLHGTVIYYLSVALQSGAGAILTNGWVLDRGGDFYAPYIAVVTVHTYTVWTESHAITIAHWFCFLFSVWTCFLFFWLFGRLPTSQNSTFLVLLTNPSFYLSYLGLLTAVCVSLALYAIPKLLWFPDILQRERLLVVHLWQKKSKWQNSKPVRVLRTFFQEDNPSHFWKSLSPYHALRYTPPPPQCFTVPEEEEEEAQEAQQP